MTTPRLHKFIYSDSVKHHDYQCSNDGCDANQDEARLLPCPVNEDARKVFMDERREVSRAMSSSRPVRRPYS